MYVCVCTHVTEMKNSECRRQRQAQHTEELNTYIHTYIHNNPSEQHTSELHTYTHTHIHAQQSQQAGYSGAAPDAAGAALLAGGPDAPDATSTQPTEATATAAADAPRDYSAEWAAYYAQIAAVQATAQQQAAQPAPTPQVRCGFALFLKTQISQSIHRKNPCTDNVKTYTHTHSCTYIHTYIHTHTHEPTATGKRL
jgi:hypothetical protein